MTIQTVPFSRLVAADAINARAVTKDGLDELAASIAAKGLIQALAVRPADTGDKFEVIDGRRRYQAIAKLVKAKTLKKDHPVPVVVRNEDDAEALETSLAANTVRLPMHPVDQHAVFARLVDQGKQTADIAARFGIAEKTVRQHMALGRLAPEVRDAWRKGKLDAKAAQAFAAHPDPAVQASTYAKLSKEKRSGAEANTIPEYRVRQEMRRDREPVKGCSEMALVGMDAYLAAGGTVSEDLFSDDAFIDDMLLLRTLARAKLQAECDRLIAEGWSWAVMDDDNVAPLTEFDEWQCDEVREGASETLSPEDFTPVEKARSGCIVRFDGEGEFEITAGLIKPSSDASPDSASRIPAFAGRPGNADESDGPDYDAGDENEDFEDDEQGPGGAVSGGRLPEGESPGASEKTISRALSDAVHEALSVAVAKVICEDPALALRILLAQLAYGSSDSPVKGGLDENGRLYEELPEITEMPERRTFAGTLTVALDLHDDDVQGSIARRVAGAVDCAPRHQQFDYNRGKADDIAALVAALPGDEYLAQARAHFDRLDYFTRAPKAVAIAALEEMVAAGRIPPLSPTLAGAKKGEIAQAAADHAGTWGWLPRELRHPEYALTRSPEAVA